MARHMGRIELGSWDGWIYLRCGRWALGEDRQSFRQRAFDTNYLRARRGYNDFKDGSLMMHDF